MRRNTLVSPSSVNGRSEMSGDSIGRASWNLPREDLPLACIGCAESFAGGDFCARRDSAQLTTPAPSIVALRKKDLRDSLMETPIACGARVRRDRKYGSFERTAASPLRSKQS